MAAINIHIGTQAPEDREGDVCEIPGAALGAARGCIPAVSATHNGLTRMVWVRRALTDLMAGRQLSVVDGYEVKRHYPKAKTVGAALYFMLDRPFLVDDIPWMAAATGIGATGLIGESGKMACPTWDLPAGSPLIGGSCPGATAGQTVVAPEVRHAAMGRMSLPVIEQTTICQICYAEGGQYASPHVQLGEVLRYAWCKQMLDYGDAASRAQWVATVVRAIQGEAFPVESQIDPRTGKPILPMRVHSSGDFYSPVYAKAWIEVMNALPEVMFWAPTRTWAEPAWIGHWPGILAKLQHGNLALRPSAYHTDDPAPSAKDHPWAGGYPFPTAGSTSVYKFDDKNRDRGPGAHTPPSIDPRYDWPCPTYRILDDKHSCPKAVAPNGELGCRACWLHPEMRVNYTTH